VALAVDTCRGAINREGFEVLEVGWVLSQAMVQAFDDFNIARNGAGLEQEVAGAFAVHLIHRGIEIVAAQRYNGNGRRLGMAVHPVQEFGAGVGFVEGVVQQDDSRPVRRAGGIEQAFSFLNGGDGFEFKGDLSLLNGLLQKKDVVGIVLDVKDPRSIGIHMSTQCYGSGQRVRNSSLARSGKMVWGTSIY
jgi:hypothetical protein